MITRRTLGGYGGQAAGKVPPDQPPSRRRLEGPPTAGMPQVPSTAAMPPAGPAMGTGGVDPTNIEQFLQVGDQGAHLMGLLQSLMRGPLV